MQKFTFALLLLLTTSALAVPTTLIVKPSFAFGGKISEDGLKVKIDLARGFKQDTSEDKTTLTNGKSIFDKITLELLESVPNNIGLNNSNWVVKDTSAAKEGIYLNKQPDGKHHFHFYRRLNPKNSKLILGCNGVAQNAAEYQAILKMCRSARQ